MLYNKYIQKWIYLKVQNQCETCVLKVRRNIYVLSRRKHKDLIAAIQEWFVLRNKASDGFGKFNKKSGSGSSGKEAPKTEPPKPAKETKKEAPKSPKSKSYQPY